MKQLKKIPFVHRQTKYVIGIFGDEKMFNIVTFLNNRPFNCFRYQILIPKHVDRKRLLKSTVINHFVELSKNDIIENRWGKFLKEK